MRFAKAEPFPNIFADSKEEGKKFELAAKSQLKKIQKLWVRENYKNVDKLKREEEDAEKRNKNLEDAKKVIISEDKTLPVAKLIKIDAGKPLFKVIVQFVQL